MVILLPKAGDAAQRFVVVLAAIMAAVLAHWADRLVWTPLLRKAKFWATSLFLVGVALPLVLLIGFVGGAMGLPRQAVVIAATSTATALLFSWAFSAIRSARSAKE